VADDDSRALPLPWGAARRVVFARSPWMASETWGRSADGFTGTSEVS
jgi:hypothetical protein